MQFHNSVLKNRSIKNYKQWSWTSSLLTTDGVMMFLISKDNRQK